MKTFLILLGSCLILSANATAQIETESADTVALRAQLNLLKSILNQSAKSPSKDDYFNCGVIYATLGDTVSAIEHYTTAIEYDDKFANTFIGRGTLYQGRKQYELAAKDLNQAIKLDRTSTFAFNDRGFLYLEMEKFDLAIEDFQTAISLDPKNTKPYMNLVDIYQKQRQQNKVFETMNALVEANVTDPMAYMSRSDVYIEANLLRLALQDIDKAVQLSGTNPDYLIERAKFKDDVIYDDLGSIEDCDLAIAKNPNKAEYYYQRSRPYYDLEDFVPVLENCDKALQLDPGHTNAMIMKANVMDMYGETEAAKKLYNQAIALEPDQYDGYKQLSITEYAQGNLIEAMNVLERYLERGNSEPKIIEQHGKIAAELKKFEIAQTDFTQLIERFPTNPEYLFLRAIIYDSLKNSPLACSDLLAADKLGLAEAHLYLREHYPSKINAKQLQFEVSIEKALNFESVGNYAEAIKVYDEILLIVPDSSAVYHARGIAKRRLNKHADAIVDYKKAIALDESRVAFWVSMGVSYSYLDNVIEAKKCYEKAIKVDPSYAMSYYNLAGILAINKEYDKAIDLLETCLVYDPNYIKAMVALGDCYLDLEAFDKACAYYQRAEKAGDNSVFGKRVRACN